jgi:hypothetical protein
MEDETNRKPELNLWHGDQEKDLMSIQQWIESIQNLKGKSDFSLQALHY